MVKRGFKMTGRLCILAVTAAGLAAPAAAQPDDEAAAKATAQPQDSLGEAVETAEGQPSPQARAMFTLRGQHDVETNFDGAPGSVSINRAAAELSMQFPMGARSRLGVTLTSEFSNYSFNGATGFGPGEDDPWDEVLDLAASAVYSSQINRQWGYFAGAGVGSVAQQGADFGDSVSAGIVGGVSYTVSETLSFGVGAIVRTRLEDSVLVLPFINLDWQISERWRAETRTGSDYTGGGVSYSPQENLTFALIGGYKAREFRLDEESASPEGVGRDSRAPIFLEAKWRITPQVTLVGTAGVQMFQEFTLEDPDGNELVETEADPTEFFSASVTFSF